MFSMEIRGKQYCCAMCGERLTVDYEGGLLATPMAEDIFQDHVESQQGKADSTLIYHDGAVCDSCFEHGLTEQAQEDIAFCHDVMEQINAMQVSINVLNEQFLGDIFDEMLADLHGSDLSSFRSMAPLLYKSLVSGGHHESPGESARCFWDKLDKEKTLVNWITRKSHHAANFMAWRSACGALSVATDKLVMAMQGKPVAIPTYFHGSDPFDHEGNSVRHPVRRGDNRVFFSVVDAQGYASCRLEQEANARILTRAMTEFGEAFIAHLAELLTAKDFSEGKKETIKH